MNYENLQQLRTALEQMDTLIFNAVAQAQQAGFDPNNTMRGLVITDEDARSLVEKKPLDGMWGTEGSVPDWPQQLREEPSTLAFMGRVFQLTDLDLAILLLCLAPELDHRYERLYGYLQDDVTQRRPTVNLVMNILGVDARDRFAIWERLGTDMPLRTYYLIDCVPDPARPHSTFITHYLKLDRRTVAFLLGSTIIDDRIQHAVTLTTRQPDTLPNRLSDQLSQLTEESSFPVVMLYGQDHASKADHVSRFSADAGLPLITVDMTRLAEGDLTLDQAWHLALREVLFNGSLVLVRHWEATLDPNGDPINSLWTDLLKLNRLVFISVTEMWEPKDDSRARRLIRLHFDLPDYASRQQLWQHGLHQLGVSINEHDLASVSNKFRLTTDQIARAIQVAADWAATHHRMLNADDLMRGAQAHASLKLDQLATRIDPRYRWEDLILPPDQTTQIEELIARVSHAVTVHTAWGFGDKGTSIRRVSALFAGESGTGKTMAAEVIAGQLGLVMYKIDLSSVVSKYIGETEKNLKSIFDEARAGNAILFFDEADALFGKRSEVKDAQDRYANIEVAYLLQQIEGYDGVAIMATNLRQNLDEAFTRRLDFVIDFPFPDAEYRFHIWKAHFPARAPLGADVDIMDLAERYRLAGGNIRNAALAAAYLAASEGDFIMMQHIKRAVRREHQKMGRLLDSVRD